MAQFHTKFNVNDEVFILTGSKLSKRKIHSIFIQIEKTGLPEIKYWYNEGTDENFKANFAFQPNVFASKEEFINQLEI